MTNRIDRFKQEPVIVIGSGIAGLLLSIELADEGCRVILVTKGDLNESNTAWAQGGLAAVTHLNAADTKEQHLADTIAAGDGLTDQTVAESIIADGAKLVGRLAHHGVKFDQASLALEGGHHMARVLHSADATGRAIIDALIATAKKKKQIEVMEDCFLKEILVENNHAYGVVVADMRDGVSNLERSSDEIDGTTPGTDFVIQGRAVVLATGGLGQIYARTTNPGTATGDGIAIAYRAGAHLVDMEFVQFHPTALHLQGAPAFLISEAARGAGAVLLNQKGERFAHRYHPAGELATRDIVSRAIYLTMQEEGSQSVWLDMRPIGEQAILERFPNIVAKLRTFGIDPLVDLIPVSPAAHYFMGGVLTDETGCTTLESLYAIGECASTGLHGANRLASNSLLEGGVMALKLARVLADKFNRNGRKPFDLKRKQLSASKIHSLDLSLPSNFDREDFRHNLLKAAGLVRAEHSLETLLKARSHSASGDVSANDMVRNCDNSVSNLESVSTFQLGMLIIQSALLRQESRGAHWRQDYPVKNDNQFSARLLVNRSGFSWMSLNVPAIPPLPVTAIR